MNFKTTTVLIGVLAVVLLAYVFVSREAPEKAPPSPVEQTLLKTETANVTKLAVTSADGKRMVVEKQGGDWKLVEPIAAPAETWAVDSLVRAVAEMKSRGHVELTSSNSGAAGLDQPRYTVEITTKDGKAQKVKVGSVSAVGGNLYVQTEGQKNATLVDAALNEQLEKPYTAFRQTKLVNVPSTDVKQLVISKPNAEKLVLRKEGEQWSVVEPVKMPAEASEVSSLTSGVTFLNATEFVSEDEVPALVNPDNSPRLTVWLSKDAPTTQPASTQSSGVTVAFGGFDSNLRKNLYVSVSEPKTLAKVTASAIDVFQKKPLDLRDRKVLEVKPEEVSKVEVVRDTPSTTQPTTKPAEHHEVVIVRKAEGSTTKPATQPTTLASTQPTTTPALPETKWALGSGADASQAEVDALIGRFHPLRATKYLESSSATTQPVPTYVVRISTQASGGAKAETHEVRLRDTGTGPLVGQYQDLMFEVDRSVVDALTKDFANKAALAPEAPMEMPAGFPGGIPGLPPGHP